MKTGRRKFAVWCLTFNFIVACLIMRSSSRPKNKHPSRNEHYRAAGCDFKTPVSGTLDNSTRKLESKGKIKFTLSGHEGPEVEYRYCCTLYLTSALDVGGWSTPRPGRFTPGKEPVLIV